ncbi:MAG: DEAD/DEAH box helicase family protein [Malacoplasma sp.]
MDKEALARIKINDLLVDAGWRFFDDENGYANIQLEPNVKISQADLESVELKKKKNGFIDYLLLDDHNFPFVVVEAKKDGIHPLEAKEQARKYANSLRCKYIILTNGSINYFWNIEKGNPEIITTFPTYESLKSSSALTTDTKNITDMKIDKYFVATSQEPSLEMSSAWKSRNDEVLFNYCLDKDIRVLRHYQLGGIKAVQTAISDGKTRFLLEMATGTGKTLTSAGVIKMFVRSEVAQRVLFLVDRIELENQAQKDLGKYLSKDGIKVAIYKENKQDWTKANVVISTIQSFTSDNKYQKIFVPTDFDLVISDEAHRSLGSNNRAVFEYFLGYKLGLTATPKNYLKGVAFSEEDPRELERRILLDTYHIFGCDSGNPTFSYTLNDGVKNGILINPTIVDARTDITNELLSEQGLIINTEDDNVEVTVKNSDGRKTKVFTEKSYEKKFFSDSTNQVFCVTFMENALRDPITNEIGKSIIFCVNQAHARKVTEILNVLADKMFPNKYNSDFAVQVTSNVNDAQQMTINFANNKLNGFSKWNEEYETSKSRVAVTVGMMTTGYDCSDILNLGLMRPIFSPTDFIQMKGRGTRLHSFKHKEEKIKKETFKLFDFFAVCEFFESKFQYDEKLNLPKAISDNLSRDDDKVESIIDLVKNNGVDFLLTIQEEKVPDTGMVIDRKFYTSFEEKVKQDPNVQKIIDELDIEKMEWYLKENIFNKPSEYFNINKLEQALGMDRKITVKEVALNILGLLTGYKSRKEKLYDEFNNFKLLNKEELEKYAGKQIDDIEAVFEAYIVDEQVRECVYTKNYSPLFNSVIKENLKDIRDIRLKGKPLLEYIKDYISENDINCNNFKRR